VSTDRRSLRISGPAVGGGAVGRDDDGRVTFVDDALPGELVTVEVFESHDRFARARLVSIEEPSPARVEPPCPHVAEGCGGCDLQHATVDLQRSMKEQVVRDALERIGRVEVPELETVALGDRGFRTTIRAGVRNGRAGFRARRSHDVVVPDTCLVAHPLAEGVLLEGRFDGCEEVTIRVGAATGERLVVASPDASGVAVPDDVVVVGRDELRRGRQAAIHEEVAGRTWRISARSFFQTRPDGAEALAGVVRAMVDRHLRGGVGRLVDLYAGVGLFAGSLDAVDVTAVERSASSVADARHNLGDVARVVRADVDRWSTHGLRADLVVADPSREGLGTIAPGVVGVLEPSLVVLVSCDAGSFGRDAGALVEAGYTLDSVTLVDLFPHTHHVEVVSAFVRA
jgi:23S rRNA (uracil1939-C5)-methyltransferase